MAQRKKLDLRELELQLPPMDSNETKIILGGNYYNDDDSTLFHLINPDGDTIIHIIENCVDGDGVLGHIGQGNNNGGDDDDDYGAQNEDGYSDQGDLDHWFDDAGGDDDGGITPGMPGFSISAAVHSITSQMQSVYNGLSQAQIQSSFSFDSDFNNFQVFGSQLSNVLATNSCLAQLVGSITTNSGSHVSFDIVQNLPNGTFGVTSFDPNTGVITIQLNQSWLSQSIGWNVDNTNPNSHGINYADLGMNEDFVALLTHELIHAQNYSLLINAMQNIPTNSISDARDYMLNNLHVNPSLVDALFTVDPNTGEVKISSSSAAEHNWMADPNNGVINTTMTAVNEFIADMQKMQTAVNNLSQLMDFAQKESTSTNTEVLGEGYPEPSEWHEIFVGLQHEMNEIKNNWGTWLNYNGY